jgi:hypothetical protein
MLVTQGGLFNLLPYIALQHETLIKRRDRLAPSGKRNPARVSTQLFKLPISRGVLNPTRVEPRPFARPIQSHIGFILDQIY